jgi:CheY-like chemotaxis protein
MKTVRLVHWNDAEAGERAARLEACGYAVEWQVRSGPELVAELKTTKASAIVIDLDRLPSHGRDVGIYVRRSKATRTLPIVFVGGDQAKIAAIRQLLPDADYTTWTAIESCLARALARPTEATVVPPSVFAPYAGRPLAGRLGIRAPSVVALLHPPPDFLRTLGDVPGPVTFVSRLARDISLAIWFVRSRRELDARIDAVAGRVAGFPIWIAWPKKTAGSMADVTQQDVRRAGLATGLVDYKICAIDATWSALLFRRRR